MIHEFEQLWLDQKQVGNTLGRDRLERVHCLVAIFERDHAAAKQGDVDQDLREICEGAVDELPPILRARNGDHRGVGGEASPTPLGDAGAAAG